MFIEDRYEKHNELIYTLCNEYSEDLVSKHLFYSGAANSLEPRYCDSLERIVFFYGDQNEVYTGKEIRFIEQFDQIMVYDDMVLKLHRGIMPCRTVAVQISRPANKAINDCIMLAKIVNKALSGFNLFFFICEDAVMYSCQDLSSGANGMCIMTMPITEDTLLECMESRITEYAEDSFVEYYNSIRYGIDETYGSYQEGYDEKKNNSLARFALLEELIELSEETGLSFSSEINSLFYELYLDSDPEENIGTRIQEANEDLDYIQSKRINTLEMLFDADEMLQLSSKAEAENEKIANTESDIESYSMDREALESLGDPEETIKLLKKRKGI